MCHPLCAHNMTYIVESHLLEYSFGSSHDLDFLNFAVSIYCCQCCPKEHQKLINLFLEENHSKKKNNFHKLQNSSRWSPLYTHSRQILPSCASAQLASSGAGMEQERKLVTKTAVDLGLNMGQHNAATCWSLTDWTSWLLQEGELNTPQKRVQDSKRGFVSKDVSVSISLKHLRAHHETW